MNASPLSAPVVSFGDFNGDHKIDVLVSIGGSATGQEIVFLGNGDGTFQAAKSSAGLYNPTSVAVGDFNGDGKLDLVVDGIVLNGGSVVSSGGYLLLGNGDGTFQSPVVTFPSAGPVAAADLNGDGKLDLVMSAVDIYLGNGDGTFSNTNNYVPVPISGTSSSVPIAIADFNLDGKPDIAVGNNIFLGNGNGTFQAVPIGLAPGSSGAFVTGAFDKTSAPEVAVVSVTVNNTYSVSILSNNGSGVLSLAHTYPLQQPGSDIVTADFNGDGNLDLMVLSADPNSQTWGYSVLLGNGDGTFQPPSPFVSLSADTYLQGNSAIIGDFSGDKKLDVAVPMTGPSNPSTLAVLLGHGDGTFAAPTYVYDGGATLIVAADFNGDGKLDIAASGFSGSFGGPIGTGLLFGNGDGTFQPAVFPSSLSNLVTAFTADLNNDGKADLVGSQVALGNGDGTFTLLPALKYAPDQIADFNGDGKLDLLVINDGVSSHPLDTGVLLGNGDGTFGSFINIPQLPPGALPPGFGFFGLLATDMNGDGRADLLFPNSNGLNGVAVLLNTTAAGFQLSATALSPASVSAGSSTTSTVSVVPAVGFTGAVTLSCVGLPGDATCQFIPPSVAGGSGTSSLTITTTSSAASGTYPVQVQGAAGSLTTTATLSLVIQAPAASDFTIAPPTAASQTITAGQSAKFALALTPTGSFSGTVNLTCAIAPAATPPPTCTLSRASVQITGSGAQSVTATVATTAPTTTAATPPLNLPAPSLPLLWTATLLSFAWLLLRYRKRQPILARYCSSLASASLAGCGGGSSPSPTPIPGTPSGTYTATVTANSGNSTHATTVQVTVQ